MSSENGSPDYESFNLKPMEEAWFKKAGWIYLRIHPMGYFVTLLAILFMVSVVLAVIRHGHSVSDDLYELFVFATCIAFWWKWIAEKTSI